LKWSLIDLSCCSCAAITREYRDARGGQVSPPADGGGQPSAAIFDARTLQSTPESGARVGYDGHKRCKGSKVHAAVDTLGHVLTLLITPADAQERTQADALAHQVQEITGETVEVAYVDQGYTGEQPTADAAAHGIRLEVVKLPKAKRGFVLPSRRWVVEPDFAWTSRFRRLVRDHERLPQVLARLHFIAFACLMLHRLIPVLLVHNTL
jgi:transposase